MTEALIENRTLVWAVERADVSTEALARKIHTSEDRVEDWLSGEKKPTFKQAMSLADALHVPFGYLFLKEPPKETFPIPDFRTVGSTRFRSNNEVLDLLRDIQQKREWFLEYKELIGADPLPFVGSLSKMIKTPEAASKIRSDLLSVDANLFDGRKSQDQFLTAFMNALENLGVWVMRSGIVGNNTHRPLDVSAFRGFALSDRVLPIIFINGQDAKAAQIFTLAHEVCHIWLGTNDVSDTSIAENDFSSATQDESYCNSCAAELLVPAAELQKAWRTAEELSNQVDNLARQFSVSRIVIARRALDLNLLHKSTFDEFYSSESARWAALKQKKRKGGNFYTTIPVRNGRAFTKSVLSEAMRGTILLREASRLLGIKPSKVAALQAKMVG